GAYGNQGHPYQGEKLADRVEGGGQHFETVFASCSEQGDCLFANVIFEIVGRDAKTYTNEENEEDRHGKKQDPRDVLRKVCKVLPDRRFFLRNGLNAFMR